MLITIAIVLGLLWLVGLLGHVGGNLVHLVLFVAIVILIYDFVTGRRHEV